MNDMCCSPLIVLIYLESSSMLTSRSLLLDNPNRSMLSLRPDMSAKVGLGEEGGVCVVVAGLWLLWLRVQKMAGDTTPILPLLVLPVLPRSARRR
jgi:hypothetical protein